MSEWVVALWLLVVEVVFEVSELVLVYICHLLVLFFVLNTEEVYLMLWSCCAYWWLLRARPLLKCWNLIENNILDLRIIRCKQICLLLKILLLAGVSWLIIFPIVLEIVIAEVPIIVLVVIVTLPTG